MDDDADLARLVAEERERDATRSRSQHRQLATAAAADATLGGILLDLAEDGEPVVIRTTAGRTVRGRVVLVARDAIAVEGASAVRTYLRLDAIGWVKPQPGRRPSLPAGDRPAPRPTTFAALIGGLAPERPRVAVLAGGEPALLTGELLGAGTDVVTVRLDGDPPVTTYFATAQLSEVTVLAR